MSDLVIFEDKKVKNKLDEVMEARKRKQAGGGQTRLSLSEVAGYLEVCFDDGMQAMFSQLLAECKGADVRFGTLNGWIEWLDGVRAEYLEDAMAVYVIDFYRGKLKSRRYWKYVNERAGVSVQNVLPRRPDADNLVNYAWARKELAAIAVEEAAKDGKVFGLGSDRERKQWQLLLRWFLFLDDGLPIDSEKWFFMYGLPGTGKSFVLRCLIRLGECIVEFGMCPERDAHFYRWNYCDLDDLANDCRAVNNPERKPSLVSLNKVEFGNWMFDELGNEPLKVRIYSDEYRFFETILTKREKGKTPRRSIVVSNENVDFVHKRYNEVSQDVEWTGDVKSRFSSRWNGLFRDNVLVWVGEDRR